MQKWSGELVSLPTLTIGWVIFFRNKVNIRGDSNESKIRVAEYSTILFQQGQPRFVLNLKNVQNV